MHKHTFSILAAIGVLWAVPVLAIDLHEARRTGVLGEKNDGYVQAIVKSAEAGALADEVNAKRKEKYLGISKENGQPVAVVAKIAAQEIINNLESGAMYQDAGGHWQKK